MVDAPATMEYWRHSIRGLTGGVGQAIAKFQQANYDPAQVVWLTRDGQTIKVSDMGTRHLQATHRILHESFLQNPILGGRANIRIIQALAMEAELERRQERLLPPRSEEVSIKENINNALGTVVAANSGLAWDEKTNTFKPLRSVRLDRQPGSAGGPGDDDNDDDGPGALMDSGGGFRRCILRDRDPK